MVRQTDRAVSVVGFRVTQVAAGDRTRFDARQIIDRAVASLAARCGMTEREAFRWLQRTAMDHRSSMRAVGWLVIAGVDRGMVDRTRDAAQARPGSHSPGPPPSFVTRRRPGTRGGTE